MKLLVTLLFAGMALCGARPGLVSPYHAAWIAAPASSQYHAQDEFGQYSYGYAGGPSSKHEVKTWDGVTRGGYSYIDANGLVQTVNYIADPVHGFRVAATNLPVAPASQPIISPVASFVSPLPVQDTAEVAAAKAAHLVALDQARLRNVVAVAAPVAIAPPAPVPIASSAPVVIARPAPVVIPAVSSSQYHAQDELGQYSYGYAGGPSAKHETKTWDGVTRGGYSYIDANGLVQTVNYISDPINGFRVAATNLPVAPDSSANTVQYIADDPQVAAAKIAHFAAHAEAKSRLNH